MARRKVVKKEVKKVVKKASSPKPTEVLEGVVSNAKPVVKTKRKATPTPEKFRSDIPSKPIEPPKRFTNLNELELQVYDKIVADLRKVDAFTCRTATGIDTEFIKSFDGRVIISVEHGVIITPYKLNLTDEEKKILVDLIKPIAEREKTETLKVLLKR